MVVVAAVALAWREEYPLGVTAAVVVLTAVVVEVGGGWGKPAVASLHRSPLEDPILCLIL